eukprot:TRINITY_DN15976_c0_g1_i1.p1 TRINITY_DN15976_c0_g1~~TRINITY_DN15976_c0_g1_i1.p1  ORF type:complete len:138 (+),score=24.30 TRINITY_DN15976_c0_g1_i1:58-471(+)
MAMTVLGKVTEKSEGLSISELETYFSPHDLKRLDSYSHNLIDYHVILDMLPIVSRLFFLQKIPISLSLGQCCILLGLGLQHKNIEQISEELNLPTNQLLALFNKSMRKVTSFIRGIQEKDVEKNSSEFQKNTIKSIE